MKINTSELSVIATRRSQYPSLELPEFLLVGRSNVGKSSFINTVLGRKDLARVSSTPGKTQTLNFYHINNRFYLIDAPGYGYAAVSKETQAKFGMMIEDYLKTRDNLKVVFLLIDYRHKPTEDDVLMYNFLKYYNLNIKIIATKYDKVSKNNREKADRLIRQTFGLDDTASFVPFSTITKKGREDILDLIANNL